MDRHGRPQRALSDEQVAAVVAQVVASGATAAAVCLLFSFANPAHEQALGAALQRAGIDVSLCVRHLAGVPRVRAHQHDSNERLPTPGGHGLLGAADGGARLAPMGDAIRRHDGAARPAGRPAGASGPQRTGRGIVGALAVARAGGRASPQPGTDGGRGGAGCGRSAEHPDARYGRHLDRRGVLSRRTGAGDAARDRWGGAQPTDAGHPYRRGRRWLDCATRRCRGAARRPGERRGESRPGLLWPRRDGADGD